MRVWCTLKGGWVVVLDLVIYIYIYIYQLVFVCLTFVLSTIGLNVSFE